MLDMSEIMTLKSGGVTLAGSVFGSDQRRHSIANKLKAIVPYRLLASEGFEQTFTNSLPVIATLIQGQLKMVISK